MGEKGELVKLICNGHNVIQCLLNHKPKSISYLLNLSPKKLDQVSLKGISDASKGKKHKRKFPLNFPINANNLLVLRNNEITPTNCLQPSANFLFSKSGIIGILIMGNGNFWDTNNISESYQEINNISGNYQDTDNISRIYL